MKSCYYRASDVLSCKKDTRLFSGHATFQMWLKVQLSPVQGKARGTKVNDRVQERRFKQHGVND